MRPGSPSGRRRRSPITHSELGTVQRRRVRIRASGWLRPGLLALACFLAIATAASSIFAAYMHNRSSVVAATPHQLKPSRAVVFVIDGASPQDLQDQRNKNIQALASSGVSYSNAWLGLLQGTGAASNAGLASGVYPWRNGLIGSRWYEPASKQVVAPTQPSEVQLGALDQLLESRKITPLASLMKARQPSSKVLSVGGVGCASASAAGTWTADYVLCPTQEGGYWVAGDVTGHAPPPGGLRNPAFRVPVARGKGYGPAIEGWQLGQQDNWIARYTVWTIRRSQPTLTIVNFPEIAEVGHYVPVGQRSRVIGGLMAGIDRDIGSIERAFQTNRPRQGTVFAVTSDEALAPVTLRLPKSSFEHAIVAAGGDQVYMTADSSAMIGLRDPLQAQPVAQAIQAERLQGIDAIYYKVRRGGVWRYEPLYLDPGLPARYGDAAQYLLWTMGSNIAPDVVVAYAPGTTTGDPALGPYRWNAGSMGIQWEAQHIPLILSGPGVRRGTTSDYPARIVDIAPTLASVLGLSTTPFDGVPLSDALVHPPANGAHRQATTGRWLSPLVDALKEREQNSSG